MTIKILPMKAERGKVGVKVEAGVEIKAGVEAEIEMGGGMI